MADPNQNKNPPAPEGSGAASPASKVVEVQPARTIVKPSALNPKPKPPGRTVEPDVRWCVAGLRGLRADVKQQIAALANVPDNWKAILQAEVDAVRSIVQAVEVHCHCHCHHHNGSGAKGDAEKKVLHLDISEIF